MTENICIYYSIYFEELFQIFSDFFDHFLFSDQKWTQAKFDHLPRGQKLETHTHTYTPHTHTHTHTHLYLYIY